MYAIETINLAKKYGSFTALDNLNLSIKQGEVYGFIGKNGAGKTTTINLILSLIKRNEGIIKINGNDIHFTDEDYKQHIGFVPDVPTFPNYMTAKDYLEYTCDMYRIEKQLISEKVEEVLTFVDLKEETKTIGGYSRGMKQRLAIAQALVHDPDIIIMDEPTSALDPIGRKEVMNIIVKLKGKKTIFYSTHILDDVERVCDRIGLLNNGVLILEDTIENIASHYVTNYVHIETELSAEETIEFLNKNKVENDIKPHNGGIIAEINATTSSQEILHLFTSNKIELKEYRPIRASLEDVFVRVTDEKTT